MCMRMISCRSIWCHSFVRKADALDSLEDLALCCPDRKIYFPDRIFLKEWYLEINFFCIDRGRRAQLIESGKFVRRD